MSDPRNPYHVLGLRKGATEAQIREAYKVLARRHHPDRNMNDPGAQARFIEIKDAYEALIERKSSSHLRAAVEEKTASLQRRGLPRRVGRWALSLMLLSLAGAGTWQFVLKDLGFHLGLRAARSGDLAGAELRLGPIAGGSGPRAREARDALVDAYFRALGKNSTPVGVPPDDRAMALLSDADDPRGLSVKGDLLLSRGDLKSAMEAWSKARARGGSEWWARSHAGLSSAGQSAAASALATEAIRSFPADDPWRAWILAVEQVRSGREAVFPEDGARGLANAGAATIARIRGMPALSRNSPERDDLLGARRSLESAYRALEDGDRSSPFGLSRGAPRTFSRFGYLYPVPEIVSRREYDWVATTSVEDPRVAVLLAQSASYTVPGLVELPEALRLAIAASELDSTSVPARLTVGNLHIRAGNTLLAEATFNAVTLMEPRRPRIEAMGYAGLARVHAAASSRVGEGVSAGIGKELENWKKAMRLDPGEPMYPFGMARAYARLGRQDQRISWDRAALEVAPDFAPARLDLGDALIRTRRESAGVQQLLRAAKNPEYAVQAWMMLGRTHYDRRRYEAARKAFRLAADSGDDRYEAEAWFRLACIHSLARRRAAGLEAYIRMVKSVGGSEGGRFDAQREPALAFLLDDIRAYQESSLSTEREGIHAAQEKRERSGPPKRKSGG